MNAGVAVLESRFVTLPIDRLRVGTVLRAPIFEDGCDQNILLLAAGTRLTPSILDRIARRGQERVRVLASELQHLISPPAGRHHPTPDEPAERAKGAFLQQVRQHESAAYDSQTVAKFCVNYDNSLQQMRDLLQNLASGCVQNGDAISTVSSTALVQMAEDMDIFVALGITPHVDQYPYGHSLQTAMLAMSAGAVMGLRRDELLELGMGCLVHDAGMLRLNHRVFETDRGLDSMEFLEITKHPSHTFQLVRGLNALPNGSRMVAYQMHERFNGSGYPCRRQGRQIHPLSHLAAVADVFVALISPRPHRPGMLPCHAMEAIVRGVSKGLYERESVRALLNTVSLFPLGSYVQISDGRVGKVVRANREKYTQPTLELWTPDQARRQPELVNLAHEPQLKVVRALQGLPSSNPIQPNATMPHPVSAKPVAAHAASYDDNWE